MLRRGSDEPSIRSLAAQNVPAQFNGLSRRTLLAGSARITVGSVLSSSPAVAQIEPPADGSHVRPSAILGSRIYSANPDHPGRADISDNPANVPPPITRCGPRSAKRCGSISARAARTIRRPSMWSGGIFDKACLHGLLLSPPLDKRPNHRRGPRRLGDR